MSDEKRIPILDGWRAISILLVLSSHMVPLGPARLQLNAAAGAAGMAVFFCLSGFLIVSFLYRGMTVSEFLKKRLARIVPLAWTATGVLVVWQGVELSKAVRNLLFVSNLPPAALIQHGEHLWSLCVEMQFYLLAAALALVAGRRGMWAIPFLCVAVTISRIVDAQPISIVTWHRVDEILAGGILALLFSLGHHRVLRFYPLWLATGIFLLCCHPENSIAQYFRPYAAAAMVGSSLVYVPDGVKRCLESRQMAYIAEISYALYVVHGVLLGTWLSTGSTVEKYVKRPLLIATTFALAHLSTNYLERPFLRLARSHRIGGSRSVGDGASRPEKG